MRQQIKLVVYSPGPISDLLDSTGRWPEKAGITASGALLVRPDGFVAWRAREATGDLKFGYIDFL